MATTPTSAQESKVLPTITAKQVLDLLDSGKSRKEIKETLGLSHAGMKTLFKNPVLAKRRARGVATFNFVDDVTPSGTEAASASSPVASTGVAETQSEAPASTNGGSFAGQADIQEGQGQY